jgi:hypothetical protein
VGAEHWAAVIASVGTALVLLLQAWAKIKADKEAVKLSELQVVADRQEKQIARQDATIAEQQRLIYRLYQETSQCRQEHEEARGWMRTFRDGWRQLAEEVAQHVGHPIYVPELPPQRKAVIEPGEAEFLRRQAEQDVALTQELGQRIRADIERPTTAPNANVTNKPPKA